MAAAVLLILCLALWKKYGGEGKEKAAAAVFSGFFLGFFVMAFETWRFEGEETAWDAYKKEDARIWGRVEAIEEREDGFRLILGDVKTSAGTKIRRVFCYTDQAEGLKLGRRITALGVGEEPRGREIRGALTTGFTAGAWGSAAFFTRRAMRRRTPAWTGWRRPFGI